LIREELEQNPLMEIGEEEEERAEETQEIEESPDSEEDFDWEEFLQDDIDPYYKPMRVDDDYMMRAPARPPTLRDALLVQLRIHTDDPLVLMVGEYIVGSLDENGYLSTPLEQIAEKLTEDLKEAGEKSTKVTSEVVESTLQLIQGFEPSGVGARDLKECLLIQIRDRCGDESLESKVVEDHLGELERRNYAKIARSLGVSEKRVIKAKNLISTLEPMPGRAYSTTDAGYVTPDIIIDEKDDELICMLNETDFPHLRIARAYKDLAKDQVTKKELDFIRERRNKARFLIAGLEKRRRTILKIANFVKEYQREFFESGIAHLKSMNMRMIAQEVGVHEATVSRAVRGKYVKTPMGVFQFKYFFSRGVEHEGADSCTTVIQQRIKDLVAEEDKSKPLSDKQITDILVAEGYTVKRRTIAKYRTQLKILTARLRKTI
jgi:RNA polymerase sigma-54 factor